MGHFDYRDRIPCRCGSGQPYGKCCGPRPTRLDIKNPNHVMPLEFMGPLRGLSQETGERGTSEMLSHFVSPLDAVSLLLAVAFADRRMHAERALVIENGEISFTTLASLAKHALLQAAQSGGRTHGLSDFRRLALISNDLNVLDKGGPVEEEVFRAFLRIAFENVYASDWRNAPFGRTWMLYNEFSGAFGTYPLERRFADLLGAAPEEFLLASSCIFSLAMQTPGLRLTGLKDAPALMQCSLG